MVSDLRVIHLASVARSGETLLQRVLGAHSRIHVAGQLIDTPIGRERLAFFRTYPGTTIPANHPIVGDLGAKVGDIVLVKQGIWEHRYPFAGFVLARNPVAVYASLLTYDPAWKRLAEGVLHGLGWEATAIRLKGNFERLSRWAGDIDKELAKTFHDMDFVEVFCAFFNRRMSPLADLGLPILRYEDLVAEPEAQLRTLCRWLDVEFEEEMLTSHQGFSEGEYGHGRIALWRPITRPTREKYLTVPKRARRRIIGLTMATWSRLGYALGELGEPLTGGKSREV